jgi:hypothetical protein
MSVVMRIIQRYDVTRENEWMSLERQFATLERMRPDYPKGRRLKPLASTEACNTLIWEAEFPTLEAAHAALSFFAGDAAHEKLQERQRPLFEQTRIEFLEKLEM